MDIDEETKEAPCAPRHLRELAREAPQMDEKTFCDTFGTHFLLFHGGSAALSPARKGRETIIHERPISQPVNTVPQLDFLVYALRRTGRSAFPDFVAVGRTRNNDVVIDDESVSKFHAFFRVRPEGVSLVDAGSRNGTFIDDQPAPTRQEEPGALHPGCRVRFGRVQLTFLPGDHVYNLAKRLAHLLGNT